MKRIETGKKVLLELSKLGYQSYLVGGAVRDFILGRPINDIDIATDAQPDKIMKIFTNTVPIGLKHGTVLVIIDQECFEVTTFRSEGSYIDHRRPSKVEFISSLVTDLSRRDFTINAIAMDINSIIIDPFDGRIALFNKIIKTVGEPRERFMEDPLRMLRAVRFASQLNFMIDTITWNEILNNASNLRYISKERIKIELDKIMESDFAYVGIKLLYESSLINWIKGLDNTSIIQLDYEKTADLTTMTREPLLRWFLLLYILGHEERLTIMNVLNFTNNEKRKINKLFVAYSILDDDLNTKNIKRCLVETDEEICFSAIKLLWIVNKISKTEQKKYCNELEEIHKNLSVRKISDLAINGKDLIEAFNIAEGPWIRDCLDKLFNQVIYNNLPNNKTVLLQQALIIKEGYTNEQ